MLTQPAQAFAAEAESFDALLSVADKSRTSDPGKFTSSLRKMESLAERTSKARREKLEYLLAYEAVVYREDAGLGVEKAKRLFEQTNDPVLKYRAGSLVANASAFTRDFTTGLRYLERALSLRGKVKDKSIRHEGLGSAAIIYNEMGQYALGLRYADEILRDAPSSRTWCGASHARFTAQFALNRVSYSDAEIQDIVSRCTAGKEPIGANLVRANLARKWAKAGQVKQAIALLENSMPEIEKTRYPKMIADVRALLAELKFNVGDVQSAEEHANAAVAFGEHVAKPSTLVSAYHTLYEIAAANEKPTLALDLYKRYAESDMRYQSDVKARELAYEIVRNETQQQTQQIQLLQRNNQVLRLQQTLDRENAQKARLATVFLMLVLAGIVFWAFQIKRHHQQLQSLAQTDSLTGLGNRHYFTQKSEKSLVDAARAGEPASLVMFDLDHFKAINDTYGHGAGDWVLKQVGKTCSAHCRKIDYIGRIGGEEFAVLLRGIDLAMATRLAEDCRVQLAKIDTRECGYSFVVTGSFGVSSTAQSGYDLSRLLSHADQMLYRAKNEGRNRVCAYTTEAAADHKSFKRSPTLTVVNS